MKRKKQGDLKQRKKQRDLKRRKRLGFNKKKKLKDVKCMANIRNRKLN